MLVYVDDVALTNVWEESFKDRETGEDVVFYRALLTVAGQPPVQLGVRGEDYEQLAQHVGELGRVCLEIMAQPGRRLRVLVRGVQ